MKPITEQRRQEPDFFVVVTSAGIWQSLHKCRADAEFITSKPFNPGYSILKIYTAPPVSVIKFPEEIDNWSNSAKKVMGSIEFCGDSKSFTVGANWMLSEIKRLNGIK